MKDQALYCIALTMPNSIIAEVNFLNIILPPFLFNCWAFLSHTQDLCQEKKNNTTQNTKFHVLVTSRRFELLLPA